MKMETHGHSEFQNFSRRFDLLIERDVKKALKWDTAVPEQNIEARVIDGHLTLLGSVDNWFQKNAAYNAVVNVIGVESVHNGINIVHKVDTFQIDKVIREVVEEKAFWLSFLERKNRTKI